MHLTHLLHRVVQQQSRRPLTVYGKRERGAAEVAERVSRLAGALQAHGVCRGDRVSILAFNSDRYFESLMATWWIGGVVNLINCRWSAADVAEATADVASNCIFVDDECAPLVAGLVDETTLVYMGDGPLPAGMMDYEKWATETDPVPDVRAGDDALAALIYTGGTTGSPKAAMHSHRSMFTAILGSMGYSRTCEPGGTALVMAPVFHIAALLGMLGQTIVGGTIVFANRFDPREVLRLIAAHHVSTMTIVPVMLQALYQHPTFGETDISSVRTIVYGAAPMPEADLSRAMSVLPEVQFVQSYGMTETAVIASLLGADHRAGGKRLRSAGRANLHAEIIIADEAGAELPRGTVGEIVTRGDHVMVGYWNRPDETADAKRDGWLHTGDLGYMDEEGYIFIVDRAKDMIITGGENVFSTEVENAMLHHPAVAACAVVAVPDDQWGERVHAVVVLQDGAHLTLDELRTHVKGCIAGFKAPRSLDFIDELPRTATGKISKRHLRRRYA